MSELPQIPTNKLTDDQLYDTLSRVRSHLNHAFVYGQSQLAQQLELYIYQLEEEISDRETQKEQGRKKKAKRKDESLEFGKINEDDDGDIYDFKF